MDFTQVDVFADRAYAGNALAVFHDASELDTARMQSIAREMNLSETSFVVATTPDSFDVRMFTPTDELPFAGHPTIGTAWILLQRGALKGSGVTQHARGGSTPIHVEGDVIWIERNGSSEPDLENADPKVVDPIAAALGIEARDVGMEAREVGRAGRLRPAFSDGGLRQLMVPVRDKEVLERCVPPATPEVVGMGAYCFCAAGAGRVVARGFWPSIGISEDPATGSAAVGLGLYLADRLGDIEVEVAQGLQIGRPSRILMRATKGRVTIGGRCVKVFEGRLSSLP